MLIYLDNTTIFKDSISWLSFILENSAITEWVSDSLGTTVEEKFPED